MMLISIQYSDGQYSDWIDQACPRLVAAEIAILFFDWVSKIDLADARA